MKPKILWVSHTGTWVGPTNSLSLLLQHLADRFDSTVMLTDDGAFTDLLVERGIPHHSLPTLRRRAIPRMATLISSGAFDLVYANNTTNAAGNALIAARLVGRPVICHIRSKWTEAAWLRDRTFKHTAAQVAVSRSVAEAFARFVPTASPDVVYNGIPTEASVLDPVQERVSLREELNLPDDAVLAVSLAHVMPRKNQAAVVSAMAKVATTVPKLTLLLAGRLDRDTAYVEGVRHQIIEAGLKDRIRLLGFRRDTDILCAASDFLVHTAEIDPHPRAVIEGMGAGLPTLAFAVDGVAETVLDQETGLLYPLGDETGLADGLVRLVRDRALRERLGAKARERARDHFTADRTARGVGDVIDRVIGRPTTEPASQPNETTGVSS